MRSWKPLLRNLVLALGVCAMPGITGCARQQGIPDPMTPNKIAHSVTVDVVIETDQGEKIVKNVWFPAGSYIALPFVVEGDPDADRNN